MPPRHNYWTIIFGNQPTSFRTATQEELLPTFRQIQGKHPDAVMKWFAHGRLWASEEEARAARSRRPDTRRDDVRGRSDGRPDRKPRPPARGDQTGGWRDRPPRDDRRSDMKTRKPAWKDRPPGPRPEWRDSPRDPRAPRPEWKDRPRDPRPGHAEPPAPRTERPPEPRGETAKPPWKDRWRNRPGQPPPPASRGDEGAQRRGRDWRPGGDHKDPRDRFKVPRDVKRARFKAKARRDRFSPKPGSPPASPKPRSGGGGKPRSGEGAPRKKKDEE